MLAAALQVNPPLVFVIAFVALIPLAHLVAEATESLAVRTRPKMEACSMRRLGHSLS